MKKDQGNQVLIAVHDEARTLLGRLRVDHASELDSLVSFMIGLLRMEFLIGYDSHRKAANAGVSANESFSVLRLVLVKAAAIEHARQHFFHVIRPRRRRIVNSIDFFRSQFGLNRLLTVPRREPPVSPLLHNRADSRDASLIVLLAEVDGAADGRVHRRAAQFLR